MMKISPKLGILLIKKYKKAQIKADMIIEEMDEDKRLIVGEVVSENSREYPQGTSIIFGKYAIFPLTLQGEDFYFLDLNDVVATTDYKE